MTRNWTFGQKIGAGYAVLVVLTIVVGVIAAVALERVVASKDAVIVGNAGTLIEAGTLRAAIESQVAAGRGYFLTRDDRFLETIRKARDDYRDSLEKLKRAADSDESRSALGSVERANADYE